MTHTTYNLTALAERLLKERRLKPLAGKIRRVQELASMHADLMMARDCLDALDASLAVPSDDDMTKSMTEGSLLSNAVVLYARATKTKSNERIGLRPERQVQPGGEDRPTGTVRPERQGHRAFRVRRKLPWRMEGRGGCPGYHR
jgi:hypothetical protein